MAPDSCFIKEFYSSLIGRLYLFISYNIYASCNLFEGGCFTCKATYTGTIFSPAKSFNYINSTKEAKFSHIHSLLLGKALAELKEILMQIWSNW